MKQICYSPHFYRNSLNWEFDCQDLPFKQPLIDWVLNGKKEKMNKRWMKKNLGLINLKPSFFKGMDDLVVKEVPDWYVHTKLDWLDEIDKLGGDELRLDVLEKAKTLSLEGKEVTTRFGAFGRSIYLYIYEAYSLIAYRLPVNYDMTRFIPEFTEGSNLDDLIQIYDEKVRRNSK